MAGIPEKHHIIPPRQRHKDRCFLYFCRTTYDKRHGRIQLGKIYKGARRCLFRLHHSLGGSESRAQTVALDMVCVSTNKRLGAQLQFLILRHLMPGRGQSLPCRQHSRPSPARNNAGVARHRRQIGNRNTRRNRRTESEIEHDPVRRRSPRRHLRHRSGKVL